MINRLIKERYDWGAVRREVGLGGRLLQSLPRLEVKKGLFHTHKLNPKMLCHCRGLTVWREDEEGERKQESRLRKWHLHTKQLRELKTQGDANRDAGQSSIDDKKTLDTHWARSMQHAQQTPVQAHTRTRTLSHTHVPQWKHAWPRDDVYPCTVCGLM